MRQTMVKVAAGIALSFILSGCWHTTKACLDIYNDSSPVYVIPLETREDLMNLQTENRQEGRELQLSACNTGFDLINFDKAEMIRLELEKLCNQEREKAGKCSVTECEDALEKNWCRDIQKPFLGFMPICADFYDISSDRCLSEPKGP